MDGSPRPLVVHFGAVGDMINLTALLRALAAAWGARCDVVCLRGAPAQVLAGLDSVERVRTLRSRRTPYPLYPDQWRLVRWLRRRGPGPTYVLDRLSKVEWLVARGGVPASHRLTTRECSRGNLEHVVEYLLRFGRHGPPIARGPLAPRFPEPPPRPEIDVSAAEDDDCRRWLESSAGLGWRGEPLVLFQTEARRENRGRWSAERWRDLIGAVLTRLPGARALLLGVAAERPRTAALATLCADPRVRDVAGELPLRRLFALLRYAHSCFSLDTGPGHAAAAMGCPVVVLMGRADPRRNRPFGPPERVQVVTAWPQEDWPATAEEWWDRHDIRAIETSAALAAWDRLVPRAQAAVV